MEGPGGWRIPDSYHRWLLLAVGTVAVVWSVALLPSGCQSDASARRTELPQSPLEGRTPGTAPAAKTSGTTAVAKAPELPKPPAQRPLVPTTEPVMRVRVASLRGEPIVLSHASGWLWMKPQNAAQGRTVRTPVSLQPTDGGWRMVEASGTTAASRVDLRGSGTLSIEPPRGSSAEIQWKGGAWPGAATLVSRPDIGSDAADLVFAVPMETYLPGVLAKELYKGWSREAYRSQAVAARSYAMCEHAWWEGRRHFDVVAGQSSQAWVGATADATSRDAVRDTRGEYLVFDGRVVPTYYSSCCGGAPASATDAIREGSWMDIAPLTVDGREDARPKDCCEKAPTARWKVTLPIAEFTRRLNAWAQDEGRKDLTKLVTVKSMVVAEANAAGRPVSFKISDGKGHVALWGSEDLRYAVNAGATGSKDTLKSGYVSPRFDGSKITLEGRGHGHGAGMCQFGAEAMGKSGRDHRQILTRYYPGSTIAQMPTGGAAASSEQASMPAGR